jgi:hypothetical protein
MLAPAAPGETYASAAKAVRASVEAGGDAEHLPFLAAMIARRRAVRGVHALIDSSLEADPAAVERGFRACYQALFDEALVPIYDATVTGDMILDRIASLAPPGAYIEIMGLQNIKGTGLDFVYRWVSINVVDRALAGLRSPVRALRERALRDLLVHDDYGVVDATLALSEVERAREAEPDPDHPTLAYDATIARLRQIVRVRTQQMTAGRSSGAAERARKLVGETLDFVDSVRRRHLATRLLDALVAGRLSHAAAAVGMRNIVVRARGAWMCRKQ